MTPPASPLVLQRGEPAPRAGANAVPSAAAHGHTVQFYQDDAFLVDTVAAFVTAGGEQAPALIVATPGHVAALRHRLAGRAVTFLDAEATLDSFMVDGAPDGRRFAAAIGSALEAAAPGGGPVRVFGEMVAILVGRGQPAAAIHLEALWNQLAASRAFTLLCAYPIKQFAGLHRKEAFERVIAAHSHAEPAEEGTRPILELQRAAAGAALESQAREDAQSALQRREHEMQDFLENAALPMHQVGADGRILWANHAELAMLGYAAGEYVGRNIAEFHADPEVISDIMARLARAETLHEYPARLVCKDGSIRHVVINSNARIEEGRLVHTRCFTRDVTDRFRLEEARQASSRLMETMSDGFLHVDSRWNVTYANPSARGGRGRLEFEGKPFLQLFPDVKGTEFEARYRQAMEHRERVVFEAYYPPTKAWMENTVIPVDDGIWLYYRDTSGRHRTEELLHARNLQQAAVARVGQEALSGKGLPQLLDMAAREVATTLGVEFCKILELNALGDSFLLRAGVGWREGLVGRLIVPADSHTQAGYTLQAAVPVVVADLSREKRFEAPTLLVEHGVTSGMSVLIHGRDRPFGVVGAHSRERRDFSEDDINFLQAVAHLLAAAIERRRIEEELRRHRDHLEDLVAERTRRLADSNQELEAFNYSVSHDLRTPLRAIAGLSGLLVLRHGTQLDPRARDLLHQVQQEAVRMGTLIEELLNLSRYHRMELAREPIDLSATCEEVLAAFAIANPTRRIRCLVQKGMRAVGDQHLIRVVLENLLGNAWKFTSAKEDALIEVLTVVDSGGTTFCVRDNGAGFDMAYAQKLFQPFQRLHSPTEFEGTGIGLATVARIVQRHGGKVWAEGRLREGASFYFALPG